MVIATVSYNHMMRKLLNGLNHIDNFVDDVLRHAETWEEQLCFASLVSMHKGYLINIHAE